MQRISVLSWIPQSVVRRSSSKQYFWEFVNNFKQAKMPIGKLIFVLEKREIIQSRHVIIEGVLS